MSSGGAGASRQPHGLDSQRHVERGQSAGFSAGSGSWQETRSGSAGTPARVFGPHFTCCWNLTAVPVRTGLQHLGVFLLKLGAPHGLVQLPFGSDRVGTGRVRSEHSARFCSSSGWVNVELGDGEGKRKAGVGGPPLCPAPPKFMWWSPAPLWVNLWE